MDQAKASIVKLGGLHVRDAARRPRRADRGRARRRSSRSSARAASHHARGRAAARGGRHDVPVVVGTSGYPDNDQASAWFEGQ